LKLKVRRKPYFVSVAPGISLGYRRNLGPGSWLVRCADGKGGAWSKGFAIADDFEDASADGSVIDFWTAQTRAKELVRGNAADASKPISIDAARLRCRLGSPRRPGRAFATCPQTAHTGTANPAGRTAHGA